MDGSVRWRCTDGVAGEDVSQLIQLDGKIHAFDQITNIGSDHHGDIFVIDQKTGELLWHYFNTNQKDPKSKEFKKHGPMINSMVVWNDALWMQGPGHGLSRVSTTEASQDRTPNMNNLSGNVRCVRMSGTKNYLLVGYGAYIDKDGNWIQTHLNRGTCSRPNFAGYGAVLNTTDMICVCYNGWRGNSAFVPEEDQVSSMTANDCCRRCPQQAVNGKPFPKAPSLRHGIRLKKSQLFEHTDFSGPFSHGNVHIRSDINRRLITAHARAANDAPVLWHYTSDGRVFEPLVTATGVYLGSSAGTVTCLDPATGAERWRFLAAPSNSELVIDGQLESRWPVKRLAEKMERSMHPPVGMLKWMVVCGYGKLISQMATLSVK